MTGDDSERIDETVRREFEAAWFDGAPRPIEEVCPGWASAANLATLEELVLIDMEMLWRRGDVERGRVDGRVEIYLGRFPILNRRRTVEKLIEHEFRLRKRHDPAADLGDYEVRFPDHVAPTAKTIVHAPSPGRAGQSDPVAPVAPGYIVEGRLGKGGMGVVYKARQLRPNRLVALKMILAEEHAGEEERRRFFQEAEAIGQLKHPNVVTIHEVGEHQGHPYLALEFVEGGTLSQEIRRQQPTAARAADVVKRLARAMHVVHQAGIIHRDLKPANVLMTADGTPKITDFGLAKSQDSAGHTATGALLGTPSYMAPEQADSITHMIGPSADIYALGAILYEMLTSQPPFRGETMVETLVQVRTLDPVPPSRLRLDVPRDLETICLKCLTKEPRKRYATAAELADDLERFEARRPILARRVGAFGRSVLWCRRNPALAGTISAAIVAVAVVAAAGLFQVIEERNRLRRERDIAQGNLYRALVGETNALLQARDTSWRWKAMENLKQAADLDVADRDPLALRDLAIRVLGNEFPCLRERAVLGGDEPIKCVAVRPDGAVAATGSKDAAARLWTIPEGKLLAVLAGHTGGVLSAAYHPGGRWLAIGAGDGVVRIWDTAATSAGASDVPAHTISLGGRIGFLDFSPDGNVLATGGDDGKIHLLTLDSATAREATDRKTLSPNAGAVRCLGFSPSAASVGKPLRIAAGMANGTIRIWDAASGREVDTWLYGNVTNSFAFLKETFISTAFAENGVHFRNLATKQLQTEGRPHMHAVRRLRVDGRERIVVAQEDGGLKLWLHGTGGLREAAVARGSWGPASDFAIDAHGRWIVAVYGDGKARVWEVDEPAERTVLRDEAMQRAPFLGKGRTLATNGVLLDFPSGVTLGKRQSFLLAGVSALTIEPAGRRLAHGRLDGSITITDLTTKQPTACAGHTSRITALTGGPSESRRFASVSIDGLVKLWDWETGECARALDPRLGPLHKVDWTGSRLFVSGDAGAMWCDPDQKGDASRQPTWHSLHSHYQFESAVAVHGDAVAFTTPQGFEVRDLATGTSRNHFKGLTAPANALAFSPDGTLIAAAARGEPTRIWNVEMGGDGAALSEAAIQDRSVGAWLAFHPNGRWLAADRSHHVSIFDVREKATIATFPCYMASAGCFSPDGESLYVPFLSAVRRCMMSEIEEAKAAALGKASVGPNESNADKNADKTKSKTPLSVIVQARDLVASGGHTETLWGLAGSPDGRWIATASHDQTAKLWDARKHTLAHSLDGHGGLVWTVAFSPDSKYVASGSATTSGGEVKVWEVETGRLHRTFNGHGGLVLGLAFHPSRPWLLSCGVDGSLHLWDINEDKPLGQLHKFSVPVYSAAFRPGGRSLAVSCADRRVAVWHMADGELPAGPPTRFLEGEGSGFYAVNFSPDGRTLVGGSERGAVFLWDADQGTRLATLASAGGQVRDLSFSDDGELLAVAAYISPTVVWDLARLRRRLAEIKLNW